MISNRYFCNFFLNINLEAEALISLGTSFHSFVLVEMFVANSFGNMGQNPKSMQESILSLII